MNEVQENVVPTQVRETIRVIDLQEIQKRSGVANGGTEFPLMPWLNLGSIYMVDSYQIQERVQK